MKKGCSKPNEVGEIRTHYAIGGPLKLQEFR